MLLLLQATVGVGILRVGPQLHAGEIAAQGIVAHILRHLTKLQQVCTYRYRGGNTEVKFFISILEHEMVLELKSSKITAHILILFQPLHNACTHVQTHTSWSTISVYFVCR